MKHLFFLVPDDTMARGIVHELTQVGINKNKIHIVGSHLQGEVETDIPEPGLLQTANLGSFLVRGLLFGAIFSACIYLLFYFILLPVVKISALGIGAVILFGMGFGFWTSGMITLSTQNPVIEKYADYIKEGHYVMMVDVPPARASEVIRRVIRHHPGARVAARTIH